MGIERTILSVDHTLTQVIQGEIGQLVAFDGAPYIKFQLLATSIEFLGACMDNHDFEDNKHSEARFNKALIKLFPKKYHKYAKKNSEPSLYVGLRCGMLHRFKPIGQILLTERRHVGDEDKHMKEFDGILYLVLEDLFDDIHRACEGLREMSRKGKLPNQKIGQDYLAVFRSTDAD